MKDAFRRLANGTADRVGSPWTFIGAFLIIVIWAFTGPVFHFSDTWQLVINTGTSVVTFLMVFLIQNTQNRDARAMQLKLNELIRAAGNARNIMVDLENCSDDEIEIIREEFIKIRSDVIAKTKESRLTGVAEIQCGFSRFL
jgi:low affinity Fe/Cu permease